MSHGSIKRVLLAILITFGMNSTAYCQVRGPGVGGKLAFLQRERVQKELGIEKNDPRVEKFRTILQLLLGEMRYLAKTCPKEEIEKTRSAMNKLQEKAEQEAEKLLTPEQQTRLQQIQWQATGISAVTEPQVVKALDINSDQLNKLEAAHKECAAKQKEIFDAANASLRDTEKNKPITNEELMKQLEPVVTKWTTTVDSILTESQKLKFEELKGKPFDLKNASKTLPNAPPK